MGEKSYLVDDLRTAVPARFGAGGPARLRRQAGTRPVRTVV
jgi:hypothetical protein